MGDETAEPLEGATEDSHAWEASAGDVYGEWIVVEDLTGDATFLELAQYCRFRRLMTKYIYFVWCCRIRVRRLPEAVKTALKALEDMIDVVPDVASNERVEFVMDINARNARAVHSCAQLFVDLIYLVGQFLVVLLASEKQELELLPHTAIHYGGWFRALK